MILTGLVLKEVLEQLVGRKSETIDIRPQHSLRMQSLFGLLLGCIHKSLHLVVCLLNLTPLFPQLQLGLHSPLHQNGFWVGQHCIHPLNLLDLQVYLLDRLVEVVALKHLEPPQRVLYL